MPRTVVVSRKNTHEPRLQTRTVLAFLCRRGSILMETHSDSKGLWEDPTTHRPKFLKSDLCEKDTGRKQEKNLSQKKYFTYSINIYYAFLCSPTVLDT